MFSAETLVFRWLVFLIYSFACTSFAFFNCIARFAFVASFVCIIFYYIVPWLCSNVVLALFESSTCQYISPPSTVSHTESLLRFMHTFWCVPHERLHWLPMRVSTARFILSKRIRNEKINHIDSNQMLIVFVLRIFYPGNLWPAIWWNKTEDFFYDRNWPIFP